MNPQTDPQTERFWADCALPVAAYLSPPTRQALDRYRDAGNRALREKKLLEFLKCVDWMPLSELLEGGLAAQWSEADRRRLRFELNAYLLDKDRDRRQAAEKRYDYKLKVIEYFRRQIPAQDKVLLESLRDYELDLTGRDVNWRHYFTLDSFRKIDAFVSADAAERQRRVAAFRNDVLTYKRNYEKLRHAEGDEPAFSFDEWCDRVIDEDWTSGPREQRRSAPRAALSPVEQAYQLMGLPMGTSLEAVKKQFRQLTLRFHPDVTGGGSDQMQRILAAYDQIRRYCRQREQAGPAPR